MIDRVPMNEEEILGFVAEDVPAYAEDNAASGDSSLTLSAGPPRME